MQVQISFDTEKESLDDLKKLIAGLQQIVDERNSGQNHAQPQQAQQKPVQKEGKTAGGGRVVPYEDLSGMMDKIFSSTIRKTR
ncbi:MAG: hypothetical protein KJ955_03975 [Nanoarchaeota archaeon]|nr:hypothetical protein [Nanoarchaeota archaeon]